MNSEDQPRTEKQYVDRPFRLVLAETQRSTRERQLVLRRMAEEDAAAAAAAQRLIADVLRGKVQAASSLFDFSARELAAEDLI
jgi:hypothetical protein